MSVALSSIESTRTIETQNSTPPPPPIPRVKTKSFVHIAVTLLESWFSSTTDAWTLPEDVQFIFDPTTDLEKYIVRLISYSQNQRAVIICAIIYLGRLYWENQERFTCINAHRLVFVGLLVAMKFCDDRVFSNKKLAAVGGFPLSLVNEMELEFLKLLDFGLALHPQEIEAALSLFGQDTET